MRELAVAGRARTGAMLGGARVVGDRLLRRALAIAVIRRVGPSIRGECPALGDHRARDESGPAVTSSRGAMRDDEQARQFKFEALVRTNEDLTRQLQALRGEIERLEIQAARVRGLAEERVRLVDALAEAEAKLGRSVGPSRAPALRQGGLVEPAAAEAPGAAPGDRTWPARTWPARVIALTALAVFTTLVAVLSAYSGHRASEEAGRLVRFERSEREAYQQRAADAELAVGLERERREVAESDLAACRASTR